MPSLMGMETGASLVPVLDPAERLVAGTTVTGQDTSRGWAALQLGIDLIPVAAELRAASAPTRVMSTETRMMSTVLREETLVTRAAGEFSSVDRQLAREAELLQAGGVSDDLARVGGRSGPWVDQASNIRLGGTVSQSCEGSCVSAVGEILTGGAVKEERLLSSLGEWSNPQALARELNVVEGGERWVGGYLTEADAVRVASNGQMGATVMSPGAKSMHMVALEPTGPGRYAVQDPLPGMCYEVDEAWVRQYVAGGVWQKF